MKKLVVVTQSEKLEYIESIVTPAGYEVITVTRVSGCGVHKGWKAMYRGTGVQINIFPKVKIESVIIGEDVEKLAGSIAAQVMTGAVGDSKIFICQIEDAFKIRDPCPICYGLVGMDLMQEVS